MKNAKINNKNLIATSIATAILVITGSTPVIGAATVTGTVTPAPNNDTTTATGTTTAPPNNDATTATEAATPTPNKVNNGEVIIACIWWPFC